MSIDNQTRLDGYNNVEALALDTKSTDKGMYLTFDCGYEYNNLTASILDTLKAKNVKAIFFCTLSYLKRNPLILLSVFCYIGLNLHGLLSCDRYKTTYLLSK
jgi:hypothetical protein